MRVKPGGRILYLKIARSSNNWVHVKAHSLGLTLNNIKDGELENQRVKAEIPARLN